MANNINCTCGHSWSKASSSKKDMYVCHICGKDNTMKDGGWLDNYGKKPNPNDVEVSTGPGFVGMGNDTTGRNYSPAWGGQFEDGGNVAQGGKSIPTMADSLALYNTSKKVLDYYKDKKYKDYSNIDYKKKELYKRFNKEALEQFIKLNKSGGIKVPTDGGKKYEIKTIPVDSYYKKLDANRYLQRERFYGALDTKAPMQLFDNRITPTLQSFYANEKVDDPLYDDNVSIYSYDPILVKPVSMLTSKERALRLKRYGKESGLTDEKVKVSTSTEKSKTEPVVKKSEETKLTKPTKTEETKPTPYTPTGSKKYILNGMEVSEEDFLGTGNTTGGSKRIIYSTPKIKDRKVLRLDGTPETDPEKIRKAMRAQEKDGDMAMGGSLPGAVGFTYARTAGSAPSNGKYAKKTKASAQDGKTLKNIKGESENFLKGWMNSPMYNKMINNSINASPNQQEEVLKAINREDQLNKVSWQFSDLDADKSWLDKLSSPTLGEFKLDKNKIFLNPNSNDKFYETAVHELSHATDLAGANIPWADVEKMWKYQKLHQKEKGKITKFFDDEDFNTYVGRPTETRARLNAIRYLGKKEGIYDPYTEKVNKDILKKLPSSILKPTQLDQLRLIYSDDQIIDLLNSVSKNDSNRPVSQAQNGKEMKFYQEGLDFKPNSIAQDGKEVTYTHQPGMLYDNFEPIGPGEKYMLKRTVTPYTSKRDIKKFTQAPTDPRQVNFLSNYAGATGEPLSKGFEYPTSVPYEGEKHWNIDRFIIDPQFETSEKLNTAESTKGEMKKNVLADMYKYFMLQNKGDRDDAWKQANKFVRQEINPRVKGEVYDEYLRKNLPIPNIMGITSLVDDSYLQKYNSVRDRTLSETTDDDDAFTELMQKNPLSKGKAFRVGMDWLMNYKGLSRKEAKKTLNKTKELPKFEQSDAEPMDMDPSKWKDGGAIVDPMGQWAHPGEVTIIPGTDITMEGVDYPVLGISDTGDQQMMYPGEDYQFDGDYVTEYPMMQDGGWLSKFDTAQGGGTFMSKLMANEDPILNKNRGDMQSYFPEIKRMQEKPKNDKAIAQNEQKIKKQILAEAVARGRDKQATVKQDNRTPRQKEIAQQQLVNLTMDEAQRNSPLAQTFSSFTPTGDNPEAGKIFAKQFVDATPPMAMLRLMNAARDVKNNPYGIGQGNGFLANTLGTLGLVGDVFDAGSIFNPRLGSAVKQSTPLKNISEIEATSPNVKSPWEPQELPGLHLTSTMEGGPISKIVEPKTGLVNVEQALGIIGKESGGASKASIIKKALGKDTPKKMDYNDFRKTVQDQLIPLDREVVNTYRSSYGIDKLGYTKASRDGRDIILNRINNTKEEIRGLEASGESNDYLDILKANLEIDLRDYNNLPLENQTIRLSNKDKFGRGSDAHDNPAETLGHIHFIREAETPDVLTMTQMQSDAFQGTHRSMPKSLEEAGFSLQSLENIVSQRNNVLESLKKQKEELLINKADKETIGRIDEEIDTFTKLIEDQNAFNKFNKAEVENFAQKSLLDKNHQERYLQELVDYAGKRGDVNKVRVPTSETAAKVQGYQGVEAEEIIKRYNEEIAKNPNYTKEITEKATENEIKLINDVLNGKKKGMVYEPEAQTILKKYTEQPKLIKKLFGVEPKIVTDSKGNSWYEFDIPNKFKGGKGEIKAFKDGGWLTKYK